MTRFNPRIVAAFLLGLTLVGGSFVMSRDRDRKEPASIVKAGETAETDRGRGFIPVGDTDNDGLPDWQNTFDIATVYVDNTPEETLSATGALAVELATKLGTGQAGTAVAMPSIGALVVREMVDKDYTSADILISNDDSYAAKKAYGNRVAQIAIENAPPKDTEGELVILNRALLRDDPTVLTGLDPTIRAYEKMLEEMLKTPVPPSLEREHLSLINVYQALLNDIKSFRLTFEDALPAMARFRRYQADAEALYTAIVLLYQKLDAEGIQWTEQDPASKLITVG